jgi:hypothetical protein
MTKSDDSNREKSEAISKEYDEIDEISREKFEKKKTTRKIL